MNNNALILGLVVIAMTFFGFLMYMQPRNGTLGIVEEKRMFDLGCHHGSIGYVPPPHCRDNPHYIMGYREGYRSCPPPVIVVPPRRGPDIGIGIGIKIR